MSEKEAFIAGFMATSEGYNGEYPGGLQNDPEEEAAKQYEKWACDHDYGPWQHHKTVPAGEKWVRHCQQCTKNEWEIRPEDE